MIHLLISLLTAHILGDFLFQPDWMATKKRHPAVLFLHVLIHALLAWMLSGQWQNWVVPLGIFVLHLTLDIGKLFVRDGISTFLIDQLIHVITILLVTLYAAHLFPVKALPEKWVEAQVFVSGLILAIHGSGILLAKYVEKMFMENEGLQEEVKGKGIRNGGRFIGQLERSLIFLFIIFGQPGGIGFLVAAKSVLRFGEAKENQKIAEYVLIGTFLSFGLAIAIAFGTKWLLDYDIPIF